MAARQSSVPVVPRGGTASPSEPGAGPARPEPAPSPAASRPPRIRITGTYLELTDRPGLPGRVMISVAKRLVPSAVRRNTVKRIVREAWRAATSSDTHDRTFLVRLRQYPGGRRPRGGVRIPSAGPAGPAPAPVMGVTAVKRALRADADRLFAGLARKQGRTRKGTPTGPAPGSP